MSVGDAGRCVQVGQCKQFKENVCIRIGVLHAAKNLSEAAIDRRYSDASL